MRANNAIYICTYSNHQASIPEISLFSKYQLHDSCSLPILYTPVAWSVAHLSNWMFISTYMSTSVCIYVYIHDYVDELLCILFIVSALFIIKFPQ